MAYTVEDGTIVAGANGYADLAYAREYGFDRGLLLPDDDETLAQVLVRGADYIDGLFGQYFTGKPVEALQAMAWPRLWSYLNGSLLAPDVVPDLVKAAQVEAAVAIHAGSDLQPTTLRAPVLSEKVGPIETKYATFNGRGSSVPRVTAVERLLAPLLKSGGALRTVRA